MHPSSSDSVFAEDAARKINRSNSCALPIPPSSITDPLQLLLQYLDSLSISETPVNLTATQDTVSSRRHNQQNLLTHDEHVTSLLRVIDYLFPPSLVDSSLAILEEGTIRKVRAMPSNRVMYVVRDYDCLVENEHPMYCSCRSYYERLKRNGTYYKHILAVILSPHLRIAQNNEEHVVTDEDFAKLLLNETIVNRE